MSLQAPIPQRRVICPDCGGRRDKFSELDGESMMCPTCRDESWVIETAAGAARTPAPTSTSPRWVPAAGLVVSIAPAAKRLRPPAPWDMAVGDPIGASLDRTRFVLLGHLAGEPLFRALWMATGHEPDDFYRAGWDAQPGFCRETEQVDGPDVQGIYIECAEGCRGAFPVTILQRGTPPEDVRGGTS